MCLCLVNLTSGGAKCEKGAHCSVSSDEGEESLVGSRPPPQGKDQWQRLLGRAKTLKVLLEEAALSWTNWDRGEGNRLARALSIVLDWGWALRKCLSEWTNRWMIQWGKGWVKAWKGKHGKRQTCDRACVWPTGLRLHLLGPGPNMTFSTLIFIPVDHL